MSNEAKAASSTSAADGYEFQASEEGVIRSLASTMRMASGAALIVGVLNLAMGGMRIWGGRMLGGVEGIGTAVVAILASMWVRNAAKSFQLVVDTKGNDIKNTLDAVVVLRRMFMLGVVACVALIALLVGGAATGLMARRAESVAPASAPATPTP